MWENGLTYRLAELDPDRFRFVFYGLDNPPIDTGLASQLAQQRIFNRSCIYTEMRQPWQILRVIR